MKFYFLNRNPMTELKFLNKKNKIKFLNLKKKNPGFAINKKFKTSQL